MAINLIANHVRNLLTQRGWTPPTLIRSKELPPNLIVVPQTPQVVNLHTLLRDRECSR